MNEEVKTTTKEEGIEAWLDRWFYERDSRKEQAEEAECLERGLG